MLSNFPNKVFNILFVVCFFIVVVVLTWSGNFKISAIYESGFVIALSLQVLFLLAFQYAL